MSFSLKCFDLPRPKLFLIDRFIDDAKKPARLTDFPKAVLQPFDKILDANLKKFQLKSGKRSEPLFQREVLGDLSQLPPFLNAGDVIIGFGVFPPSSVLVTPMSGGAVGRMIDTGMGRGLDKIINASQKPFMELLAKLNPGGPLPPQSQTSETNKPGRSKFGVRLVSFGMKKSQRLTYLPTRVGVIDAGAASGEAAIAHWNRTNRAADQTKLGETLKRLKKAEFSIASVATITDPTVLRFAGRWLAYVVLHEFWHAAEIESEHKYENGTGLTNSPDLAARDDLTFENEVVVNVTKSYEKNWCEVSLKRKRIDELKP